MKNKENQKGFSLLEIVAGIGITSILILALTFVAEISFKTMNSSLLITKSSFLLEEGVEVIKILRDEGWTSNISSLTSGNTYYFNFNGIKWQTSASNIFIDSVFERKFVLENVYRDINKDIVSSGTIDVNTMKFTVSVSFYGRNGTTTKQISGYITNLFSN